MCCVLFCDNPGITERIKTLYVILSFTNTKETDKHFVLVFKNIFVQIYADFV